MTKVSFDTGLVEMIRDCLVRACAAVSFLFFELNQSDMPIALKTFNLS